MTDAVYIRRSYSSELIAYREYRLRTILCFALVGVAVLLLTVSTVYVFLNYSSTYPGEIELGNGDIRALKASSLFCQGVSLSEASPSSKLYILPKLDLLSALDERNYSSRVFISRKKYWLRSHYLLEGSVVQIEASSDDQFKMKIIQSRGEFDDWEKSFSGEEWQASDSSARISHSFPVEVSDNYYFIFVSHTNKEYIEVSTSFYIKRKTYDLSHPKVVCNFGLRQVCSEKLEFGSEDSPVLLLDDASSAPNISFIQWECEPRIWFYVALFGGVFVLMTALFITGYTCLNRHMKKKVTGGTDPDIVANNSLRRQQRMEESSRSVVSETIPLTTLSEGQSAETVQDVEAGQTEEDEVTTDETPPVTPTQDRKVERKLTIPYKAPPSYNNRDSAVEYEGELKLNSSAKSAVRRNASFTTFTKNEEKREKATPRYKSERARRGRGDGSESRNGILRNAHSQESRGQNPEEPKDNRMSLVTDL